MSDRAVALVRKIAAAQLWTEDPTARDVDGGVTRDFQESREEEAQDWIEEARAILCGEVS